MNCFQEKGSLFLVILFCGVIHNSFGMLQPGLYNGILHTFSIDGKGKPVNIIRYEDNLKQYGYKALSLCNAETALLGKKDEDYLSTFVSQPQFRSTEKEFQSIGFKLLVFFGIGVLSFNPVLKDHNFLQLTTASIGLVGCTYYIPSFFGICFRYKSATEKENCAFIERQRIVNLQKNKDQKSVIQFIKNNKEM